jgi:hypothetical protein
MAKIKDSGPKPRNDAYTGLLAISFLALVGATVLMAMDASELGTPPPPFKADAPGAKAGPAGESFKRTDTNKVDTSANPEPKAPEPKADPAPMPEPKADPAPMPVPMPMPKGAVPDPKGVMPEPKAEPKVEPKLMSRKPIDVEELPAVVVPPVVQVGASEPAANIEAPKPLPMTADPTEPPLTVKPFIPPM